MIKKCLEYIAFNFKRKQEAQERFCSKTNLTK